MIYFIFSRVNLTPSPQASSQQVLNNGQKFYYNLQSSLTALSSPTANTTSENVSKTNSSNSISNNNNSNSNVINSKSTPDYGSNSEYRV